MEKLHYGSRKEGLGKKIHINKDLKKPFQNK